MPKSNANAGSGDATDASAPSSENAFTISISLDVKEDDGRGNYSSCPKDKNIYKFRKDLEKKLLINVSQTSDNRKLVIERWVVKPTTFHTQSIFESYVRMSNPRISGVLVFSSVPVAT